MKRRPISPLTETDIRLLQTLAESPSLESAAHAFGLSSRQFRRHTRDLLDRMGVKSARAAVAVAACRGWIAEPDSCLSPGLGGQLKVLEVIRDCSPHPDTKEGSSVSQ